MDAREKKQLQDLTDKLKGLEKRNVKLYYRMEQVLSKLEDDDKTNSIGLISTVNQLEKQVNDLLIMNSAIKKLTVLFFTIVGTVATFVIKRFFFDA